MWYSTKLRWVVLIQGEGANRYSDSVLVIDANDFDQAQQKALELGRRHEEEYTNADGQRVRWRLKEVISLDQLGETIHHGMEVYSEPVELDGGVSIEFDAELYPERSQPTQTV